MQSVPMVSLRRQDRDGLSRCGARMRALQDEHKGDIVSKPAFSVKAFGIYLLVLGLGLALVPNLLLSVFGMPRTEEVWIRVVGVLVFNIGIYYWFAAKGEATEVFRASIYTRVLVLASFAAFAVLGLASPTLVLFGAADFAGAIWTYFALRGARAGA